MNNVQNALATYERTLISANSRFDQYLMGDTDILTSEEKYGYQRFKDYGCIACHQGVNIGGNMFQKFGVMGDYFQVRGNPTEADLGRYLVTKDEEDRNVFKVPEPAQRRRDRAVLSRRLGQNPRRRGGRDVQVPARARSFRRGQNPDHQIPQDPDR